MTDFVTIKDLALELSMDKSNLRKYVLNEKIKPFSVRTFESRGQETLAVTEDEADFIRQSRQERGFTFSTPITNGVINKGVFYVIQLIPEFEPNRVKLGFTGSLENRLVSHRVSAPTAIVMKTWPCKRSWEEIAIVSATCVGCSLISNEVYLCYSIENLCARIDKFFEQLPTL